MLLLFDTFDLPPASSVYVVVLGFLPGFDSFSFLAFCLFLFSNSFLSKLLALLEGTQTGLEPLEVSFLPQGS